jgi:hypothetical protein
VGGGGGGGTGLEAAPSPQRPLRLLVHHVVPAVAPQECRQTTSGWGCAATSPSWPPLSHVCLFHKDEGQALVLSSAMSLCEVISFPCTHCPEAPASPSWPCRAKGSGRRRLVFLPPCFLPRTALSQPGLSLLGHSQLRLC